MTSSKPNPNNHGHHLHSSIHRKKRGGATSSTGAAGLDELEDEAPFISSSRDASEEDNDDASGYSDSASSLRATHRRETSLTRSGSSTSNLAADAQMSSLPTSARDKVLVNSKPATGSGLSHRKSSNALTADKTPSSGSPPLPSRTEGLVSATANLTLPVTAISSAPAGASHARRSSTHRANQKEHAAVKATLNQAAHALSAASPSEASTDAPTAAETVDVLPRLHSTLRRVTSTSSAGSDYPNVSSKPNPTDERRGDSSASGDDKGSRTTRTSSNVIPMGSALSLGNLPTGTSTLQGGTTPKVETLNQLRPLTNAHVNAALSDAAPDRHLSQPGSSSAADTGMPRNLSAEAPQANPAATNDVGGGYVDPDGTTPYDGDVEFAARTPVTQQIALGSSVPGPSAGGTSFVLPSASSKASLPIEGSAAADVRSINWGASPDLTQIENEQVGITQATAQEIRAWFRDAIYSPEKSLRDYKINPPPDGGSNANRPVRIYADGVYDLFHYAHALQLRQAKLAFPHVHLIVGVCSSSNCAQHKNEPLLTSAERYAAVRNCRWVDEVLEDAPWLIDQSLLDKLRVDYVAHDEDPYAGSSASGGSADIYQFVKDQGKFLPTRRTPGVSTSDLLARIVDVYRHHGLDRKLEKMGKKSLAFE